MTRLGLLIALLGLLAGSCASGQACKDDPVTGSPRCQPASSSGGEAAATAVAAAVGTAAVNCTINGYEPPLRCNDETKLCERIRCDEGGSACPAGYLCDPDKKVCL